MRAKQHQTWCHENQLTFVVSLYLLVIIRTNRDVIHHRFINFNCSPFSSIRVAISRRRAFTCRIRSICKAHLKIAMHIDQSVGFSSKVPERIHLKGFLRAVDCAGVIQSVTCVLTDSIVTTPESKMKRMALMILGMRNTNLPKIEKIKWKKKLDLSAAILKTTQQRDLTWLHSQSAAAPVSHSSNY